MSSLWSWLFSCLTLSLSWVAITARAQQPPRFDVVYTWVNGSDVYWRDTYAQTFNVTRMEVNRYVNADEIRLSIAGAFHMIPWLGKIFIVTMNQRFDISMYSEALQKKIEFVDHKTIIPPQYYPSFNSHGIELFLHKIPGLSEQFMYMNDDFFPVCPLTPHDIFMDGDGNRPKGWVKDYEPSTIKSLWGNYSLGNVNLLMRKKFGMAPKIFWHAGYLLHRQAYEDGWRLFPTELHNTASNKKRLCAPLWKRGDVTTPMFMVTMGLLRGYQEKNTDNFYYIWYGKVETNNVQMTRPWTQCDIVRGRKRLLFINVQDMHKVATQDAILWCNKCIKEYHTAFKQPDTVGSCFCKQLPFGSQCAPA